MSAQVDQRFSFEALVAGKLGLTRAAGAALTESAEFCLSQNNHTVPVTLKITGDAESSGILAWSHPADKRAATRTYGNRKKVTENGACAVAIVVLTELEHFPAVLESPIGTGVDYWLTGNDDTEIFLARLEVSGILNGSESQISTRLQAKLKQTEASDDTKLPAYAAVVEFGSPQIRISSRDVEAIF